MKQLKDLSCYITSKKAAKEAAWIAARTPECSVSEIEYFPQMGYLIEMILESDDLDTTEKRLKVYFDNNSLLVGRVNWV